MPDATLLDNSAELFSVIVGIIAVSSVGVGVGRWWMKRREGPASDRILLHTIDERLTGEPKTKLNPNPQPGLIEEVSGLRVDLVNHGGRLARLEIGQDEILRAMRPNGGNTTDPGDVLQAILHNQKLLLDHVGLTTPQADTAEDQKDASVIDEPRT